MPRRRIVDDEPSDAAVPVRVPGVYTRADMVERTGGYVKTSVTIPAAVLARARERAGEGGLSRYVSEALEHEERRRALAEYLTAAEHEFGPIPEEALEEVRRAWPAARTVL
jgi:hypothetical protein